MAGARSLRLSAYAAALVVTIGIVQLIASVSFYRAIDAQTLREDHARRVAELLVVGDRVFNLDPARTPAIMTSSHLEVSVSPAPLVKARPRTAELEALSRQIVRWEPALADKPIHLAIVRGERGRRDFVGSMQLAGGRWLNFESQDISSMWPVVLRATWMTAVTGLLCLVGALALLRVLTRPLRRLSDAAAAIGHGQRVVVRENGPTDLRNLAHAMNEMQERIALLLEDQAKSFEAISHDLRTPLARQKVAAELIADDEMSGVILENVDEMGALLDSLQQFLRAQHLRADPEIVELEALLQGLIAPLDCRVTLACPAGAQVLSYREPLLLALRPLLENACRYGQSAEVVVRHAGAEWLIEIADDGPGIPARHFADVLTPFFRLDEARGRSTHGFGLGIPTAHRLLTRFGGKLTFGGAAGEGLRVCVQVPAAA
jgi:two-component system osmolarity sensor histidine kinase EnvZ